MATDFYAKNLRRQLAKDKDPEANRRARRARKRWANNGAFGSWKGHPVYALCCSGDKVSFAEAEGAE